MIPASISASEDRGMIDMNTVLEIVTRSDPGMVRSNNEDSVMANPMRGFAVLADGMGGYNAGEVASGMATALLGSELEKAFIAQEPSSRDASGKSWAEVTLVAEMARGQWRDLSGGAEPAALCRDGHNTGGCRVSRQQGHRRPYRRLAAIPLAGEDFQAITRDHSLLQEQIDSGLITAEQARHSQNKNLVTRAVGIDPEVQAEIHDHAVLPGDVYLFLFRRSQRHGRRR
jgi:serine/threonine protein phosphatase PrpC